MRTDFAQFEPALEALEGRILLTAMYPGIPDDILTANGYQISDGHNGICTTVDGLVQTYAPVMLLNNGGSEFNNEVERYHPKSVDIITAARPAGEAGNWPILYEPVDVTIGTTTITIWSTIATITNIAQVGNYTNDNYFIDLPGNSIGDINSFYDKIKNSVPDTVYAAVFVDPSTHLLVLQYHFYYYGDDFWNDHESDWERITLLFDQSGAYKARYNQHEGFSERSWSDVETMEDTHPVVYVGEGGHASYFEIGHSQVNYVGTEYHYGNGEALYPSPMRSNGYVVQVMPTDRTADLSNIDGKNLNWLKFNGLWGQLNLPGNLPFGNDGPQGKFADNAWDPANILSGWGAMPTRLGADLIGRYFEVELSDWSRTDPLTPSPTINFSYSITNQGDKFAGVFQVGFYLSDDAAITTSDTLLGTATVNSLAVGNYYNGTITLTLPAIDPFRTDNAYYIGMVIDSALQVPESNELNNSSQGTNLDMLRVSSDGDLGSPADGTTHYWVGGGSILYSWNTLAAIGDEWIGARDMDIYPVESSAGTTLGFNLDSYTDGFDAYMRLYNSSWVLQKSNDNGMAPGETSVGKDPYLWFKFPDASRYYLVVSSTENHTADPRYLTGRTIGSTGSYKLTKSFSMMPDLIGTVLTATPNPVGANGLVTVNYAVTNNAGAPAGAFGIDFYLVDSGLPGPSQATVKHVDVAGLDPGATYSGQFALDVSSLVYGTTMADNSQFVLMYVDHAQAVLESDEFNNSGRGEGLDIATLTFEAHQSWSRPISAGQTIAGGIGDEFIGSRDIDVYKFAALPAATTTVTVTRTSGSLNSTLRVYDNSWTLVASDNTTSHANASVSFTSAYGDDYYLVVSDYANRNNDSNVFTGRTAGSTGNYTISATGLLCDLVPIQFTVWDPVADGSGLTTVTTWVKNNGPGAVGRFKIDYYLSTDSTITTSDTFLTEYEFWWDSGYNRRYLLAGESHGFGFDLKLPVPDPLRTTNQYWIGYIIDPANDVLETNETNNSNQGTGVDKGVVASEANLASPLNGSAVATPLTIDWAHAAAIGDDEWIGGFDLDTYSFSATAGQWLGIVVRRTSGNLDPYVRLYDSSWNLLAANDDSTRSGDTAGDCYLPYNFQTTGTYYLVVSSASNATANPRSFAGRVGGPTGGYGIIVSPAQPDLVCTSFGIVNPDAGANHTMTVQYTVANQGFAPSATYGVTFSASEDATINGSDLMCTGVSNLASLLPGQSRSGQIDVDVYTYAVDPWRTDNEYWLGAWIWSDGESDTANNINRGAGLDKASFSSEASAARPAASGVVRAQPISVGQTLAGNIGGDEWIGPYDIDVFSVDVADGQTLCFDVDRTGGNLDSYLRLYSEGWVQLAKNNDGVAPGEGTAPGGDKTTDSYLEWTFGKGGTYYVVVSSTANSAASPSVVTGRAAGTTGAYQLTVAEKLPNLVGGSLRLQPLLPVAAGGSCQAGFTVQNIGWGAAGEFNVSFYLSDDNVIDERDVLVGDSVVAGLAAGGSFEGSISLRLPETDPFGDNQYWIGMVVDSKRMVAELDESNNANTGEGLDLYGVWADSDLPNPLDERSVQARPIAVNSTASGTIGDEWIGGNDLDTYAFVAREGQTLCFDVNSPDGRLNTMVRIYDSGWNLLGENDDGAAPGEDPSANSYLELAFPDEGVYFAVIGGSGNEGSPTSFFKRSDASTGGYTLSVFEQKPDLVLSDIAYAAGDYAPGASFAVSGNEVNSGSVAVPPATPFAVEARLSADLTWGNSDDIILSSLSDSAGLDTNSPKPFALTGTIPANAINGSYYVAVRIDSGGTIDETAEDNNLWWSAAPDVVVRYTGIIEVPINAAQLVVFTEPNGDVTTVRLSGKGGGVVAYNQDLCARIERVELDNQTDGRSALTFSTRRGASGDGEVDVVDIIVHGSIGSVKGPVNLLGGMQIDGTILRIALDDVTATRPIRIGASSTPVTISFDQVADLSIQSLTPINSLTATEWLDNDASPDTITAPAVGTISIKGRKANPKAGIPAVRGDFQADLNLGFPGSTALALNNLSVAGVLDGSTITAKVHDLKGVSIGKITAGRVGDATVVADGGLNFVSASQWQAGSITAGWIGSIGTRTNATLGGLGHFGADLVLTGVAVPPRKATLGSANMAGDLLNGSQWDVRSGYVGSLTFHGTVDHSLIRSAGDITSITVGAGNGSDFGAGVRFDLLQSASHVAVGDIANTPTGTIKTFTVKGWRIPRDQPAPRFFIDSNISAKIGKLTLLNWNSTGGLFAPAGSVKSVVYKDSTDKTKNWVYPAPAWQLSSGPDDFVHVI